MQLRFRGLGTILDVVLPQGSFSEASCASLHPQLNISNICFLGMGALSACMCVYNVWCVPVPQKQERGLGHSGTGAADGCELSHWFWELISGPVEKRPLILTTDPSPLPP